MKKVLRNIVCGLAAVNLIALAASCSDGLDDDDPFVKSGVVKTSGGNNASGNGGSGSGDNGNSGNVDDSTAATIFETATVLDWGMSNTVKIDAAKFANATDTSKILFTYVDDGNTDYHKFKMMGGDGAANELYAGTAVGFTIDTTSASADELHGCSFSTAPSATPVTLSYAPTAAEWVKIKANGFAIIGHGAKVTKVALTGVPATTNTENGNSGTGTTGTDENQQTTGGETTTTEETRPAIGETVFTATGADLTIELPVNHYNDADHGIQFSPAGTKYLPKGAKSGEAYKIVMKGTASAEFTANVQFLTAAWAGFGEAINATFTTEAFDVEGVYTFGSDTAEGFMFVIGNSDATLTAKTLTLTEFTITRVEAEASGEVNAEGTGGAAANQDETTVQAVTFNTARKAYTLTTSKAVKKDDVGLTFQYFVAEGADPVSVDVTNLKVSLKIGDADAIEKTIDKVEIRHHTWDNNAQESNARVNLGIGSADEEIASGTTVVLQVLEATVSDSSKVDGITFALQQDGNHSAWDMLTAATSKPFAE